LTDKQIAFALKQIALYMNVKGVCRRGTVSDATFYLWLKN